MTNAWIGMRDRTITYSGIICFHYRSGVTVSERAIILTRLDALSVPRIQNRKTANDE
jgi:hypothetical protein